MRWYYLRFINVNSGNDFVTGSSEISLVIEVTDAPTEFGISNPNTNVWSFSQGNMSNALELEFTVEAGPIDQMTSNSRIRIYNPPLGMLKNIQLYQNAKVQLSAGFGNFNGGGLPLGNPATSGVILNGTCFMSFANWVGGSMVCDFIVGAITQFDANLMENPANGKAAVFTWKTGQPLSDAISAAFTGLGFNKFNYYLSSAPVVPTADLKFEIRSFYAFATWFRSKTAELQGTDKPYLSGYQIIQRNDTTLDITDGFSTSVVVNIKPEEIIGQPTYTYTQQGVQVQTVHPLRNDIIPNGMQIRIPPARPIGQSSQVMWAFKDLTISGVDLFVQKVTHHGKFRDPSAQGWVTVVNSAYIPQ